MINKNIGDIKDRTKVLEDYKSNVQIINIAQKYNLSYNEILSVLETYRVKVPKEVLPSKKIVGNQIIVASDTHIGSKYENLEYIKETYRYAIDHNIKSVVIVGDILQGGANNVTNEHSNPYKQFEYFLKIYPEYKCITTYILFGNHDLRLLEKDNIFLEELKKRKDLKPLGYKRTYLNWEKNLISLFHQIKHYHLNIPNVDASINLVGHKHAYSVSNRTITTPTLSNDIKYYRDNISEPGFLVITNLNNTLLIEYKSYKNDNLCTRDKIVLKKSPVTQLYN